MNAMEAALIGLWQSRRTPIRPYLLLNDPRGYFADPPAQIEIDGITIPVHPCRNEWALRLYTEAERESGQATPKILVSQMQLEPDLLPDLQALSSTLPTSFTGVDLATALGVQNPRPMLSRLPIPLFWGLAPYFQYLGQYDFNRVLLASLLDDLEILSAAWTSDRVLTKLWYDGSLERLDQVLATAEPTERRLLEQEFLGLVTPNLDLAQRAVVEVAVLEQNPPPVLPLCLLASILDGWGTLNPTTLHKFIDNSELGDLFVDVLQDGTDLSGLSTWGHRITFYADERCADSLTYLETQVFKQHPQALTEALSTIICAVGGSGAERLLSQLVRLMEADGGLLAQGLAITLHELLGMTNGVLPGLPMEPATVDLAQLLTIPDPLWQSLLEVLQRHQARSHYEDYVALLEALIALQRLTERAINAIPHLAGQDWKQWLTLVDQVYLPLSVQIPEALRLTNRLSIPINLGPLTGRAENARKAIADAYVKFYLDPNQGLKKWIQDRSYAAGTSRPWLNSDVVQYAVQPLLADSGLDQVYLIVFDGMSVSNWTLLRDRFLMPKRRELFRSYNGLGPEVRACTYLPSITHLCRRAIFAGTTPRDFYSWAKNDSEPDLLTRCMTTLGCVPAGWNPKRHYLCFNEESQDEKKLQKSLRTLVDKPCRLKVIVFNLQDRLLKKGGMSSLQEIMLTYVREIALPIFRRIANQPRTGLAITSDHGFASYKQQYVISDINNRSGDIKIGNRYLQYLGAGRTADGPATAQRIGDPVGFALPSDWTAVDVVTGNESYGWHKAGRTAANNPYKTIGYDHGGLTPEETVVPVAIYITRGA